MDTQIWYSVFCTIFGGLYGILHHLGEVSGIFPNKLM
jgi:callose synthase